MGDVCLVAQLRRELEPLFEQVLGALVVALGLRQGCQGIKHRGDSLPLAHLPRERQSSLRQRLRPPVISPVAPRHRKETKLDGGSPLLPDLEEKIYGLFDQVYRLLVLPQSNRRYTGVAQRPRDSRFVLELPEQPEALFDRRFPPEGVAPVIFHHANDKQGPPPGRSR